MGFIAMVLSMIAGLVLISLGFYCVKKRKNKLYVTLAFLTGIASVAVSVWLGIPK